MIQGGDPTGTGRFSKSIWGYPHIFQSLRYRHPFEDEITRALRFTGAGILAMVCMVQGDDS